MDKPKPIEADKVYEVVLEAHRDLEKVQALVAEAPKLVNAAWDWGGGDFETPLGAAAHTGQREIARWLLEHGALMTLPAAVMLGDLDIVQAILEHYPGLVLTPGAHGIPLLKHAEFGGERSRPVYDYLEQQLVEL